MRVLRVASIIAIAGSAVFLPLCNAGCGSSGSAEDRARKAGMEERFAKAAYEAWWPMYTSSDGDGRLKAIGDMKRDLGDRWSYLTSNQVGALYECAANAYMAEQKFSNAAECLAIANEHGADEERALCYVAALARDPRMLVKHGLFDANAVEPAILEACRRLATGDSDGAIVAAEAGLAAVPARGEERQIVLFWLNMTRALAYKQQKKFDAAWSILQRPTENPRIQLPEWVNLHMFFVCLEVAEAAQRWDEAASVAEILAKILLAPGDAAWGRRIPEVEAALERVRAKRGKAGQEEKLAPV